jgi:hypothetical protein
LLSARAAVAVLAAAAVAPAALGAAPVDPAAAKLAASLKASMTRTYKPSVPGLVFTKVTCTLAKDRKSGKCAAAFTWKAQKRKGVYQVQTKIDPTTGGVQWRAVSVACTSLATGKKIAC